jgi:hypothetical protein
MQVSDRNWQKRLILKGFFGRSLSTGFLLNSPNPPLQIFSLLAGQDEKNKAVIFSPTLLS